MEERKMKILKKIKAIKFRKIHYKNWMSFPFFLMISLIMYSFVVLKDNIPASGNFSPDKNDSIAANQPKVDIKVNKKFDEKGNLIQYDSTYSIIYSSPNADIQFFNFDNDSLFSDFNKHMKSNDFFKDDFLNGFQLFDSHQDFFQINPMIDFKKMEEMMNKLRQFQKPDSNFIQPQQYNQPQQNFSTPNMITL
jgi:hypothetical protein